MTQILLIGVFVVVIAHNADPAFSRGLDARVDHYTAPGVIVTVLCVMTAIWLATHIYVHRCARLLDRTGQVKLAWSAERAVAISRVIGVIAHVGAVFWLGWLVAIRRLVGDLVLIDELIAVLPVVALFVAGWASLYPIDRRIREAVIVRSLDEGLPVEPYVSFRAHVLSFVRHQLALVGVPVILVFGLSELLDVLAARLWPEDPPTGAITIVQLAGALTIFATVPWLMRHIWQTQPLADGDLRRRLTELCRAHRVRVRELLVWNTHGVLVNGAVMGLIGAMRYVLLSDGLLSGLTRDEVEAVAAHEVGHIRRHHIPWLATSVVVVLVLSGFVADWIIFRLLNVELGVGAQMAILLGGPLLIGLFVFGWVSRRFEWQADAFAAQHLSGFRKGVTDATVTLEASAAMVGALGAVARLNHIPRHARSWRHGSIASRQERLRSLVGLPAHRLAIDRRVARIKAVIAFGAVLTIGVIGFDLFVRMGA